MTPFWSSSIYHAAISWQKSSGSLTARLRACGRFNVRVLDTSIARATIDESVALHIPLRSMVYARTVCLEVNGRPCVVARSVTSRTAMRRAWHRVRQQGSRPLAEMLWCNPLVGRGRLYFATLDKRHAVYNEMMSHYATLPKRVAARRACFYLGKQPLLVMEAFLPEIEDLPCR